MERLVWHGVKNEHPSIIYKGNNNSFDVTYSNVKLLNKTNYRTECGEWELTLL